MLCCPGKIHAPDEVWETDITYIPLRKGFLYLVAIVDLYSRHVLSWRLSNRLDTELALDALEMALEGVHKQEIFPSENVLSSAHLRSGPGCRLWRSRSAGQAGSDATTTSWSRGCGERVQYEEQYVHAYSDG